MTAVHQFVPALLPRDATGDHTLALRNAFRAAGWESEIFVEAAHDELRHESSSFERYPARARPDDVLLYQVGTASPVAEFLLGRAERLVLDYHNVTPAAFYDGWEEHTTAKVTLAREQVAALAPRAVLGIADSSFNASELRAMGCPATEVVPILVDLGGFADRADRAEVARLAERHGDGPVFLFVGRFTPNKGQHRLVEALCLYRRWYEPTASLRLVGPAVTPSYAEAVFSLAAELGLREAVIHGEHLTPAELAAWYVDADAFVCLSEHEGFCIPLLEAMECGVPIVAHRAGAVPETLGDAGLLLETVRPSVVAAALARTWRDRALAARLTAAGRERVRAFAPTRTRARFLEVLGAVVNRPAVPA